MKNIWALSLVFLSLNAAVPFTASAQTQQQSVPRIAEIRVTGNVRVEGATILQYMTVRAGSNFDPIELDKSLKRLFATGLFSDVEMIPQAGNILVVRVVESPIINRIIFEGNKKLDNEDILEEIRIRPRNVFTRAKIKAEVSRILELYRRKGRFAAIVEPKVVQQEQNRVDIVFEIQEGPKTKVTKINFMGNKVFSDSDLRDVLVTEESRWWKIFSSQDTYDPDKIVYDQQQLRQFYLNQGYADFRIVSAVAELTPDRSSFLINYTVDEGEIYKFGKVTVESEIRDVDAKIFQVFLSAREGNTYSAEVIERSQETITDLAGGQGYAFIDIRAMPKRNKKTRTIDYNFKILEAPRVYVDRINIHGNVRTLDKVIRREFRLEEGDAFNSFLIKRSEDRLKRLGFFRPEGIEVERRQGADQDRMVIDVTVEEQATGDLNFGVGFSSVENFMFNFSINEKNFMGKGQRLGFAMNLSGQQQSANISFTEPYFLNRNIAAGGDLFIRRTDSSRYGSYLDSDSKGFTLRAGASLGEYWTLQTNYTLRFDDVNLSLPFIKQQLGIASVDPRTYKIIDLPLVDVAEANQFLLGYTDSQLRAHYNENQNQFNDPVFQSNLGNYTQSIVGYTFGFDTRNDYIRPTSGRAFFISQNIAGLGGDVKYLRSNINFDNYWTPFKGWTLRLAASGGWIKGLGQSVRLNDSFFLGGPQLRGFDVSSVGPRRFFIPTDVKVEGEGDDQVSIPVKPGVDGVLGTADDVYFAGATINSVNLTGTGTNRLGQSVGGTKQYVGRAEVFFPLGDAALEMGINASAFFDVGSLWGTDVDLPSCNFTASTIRNLQTNFANTNEARRLGYNDSEGNYVPFLRDCVIGDSWKPRASIGIGFSWQSPFGPFRIDLTKNLRKQFGDRTQTLQFNIGTSF